MRAFFITVLAAAAAFSQTPANTLVTPTQTPTAEAPTIFSKMYLDRVFKEPKPKVELKTPVRIGEFEKSGNLELSLRDYLDAVLANNTDIEIQRISIEQPRNAILRGYSIFDPFVTANFSTARRITPASDTLAGANVLNQLSQPFTFRYSQMLQTGTIYNVDFNATKGSTNSTNAFFNPVINSGFNANISQPLLRNRGSYVTKLPITIARSRLRANEYAIQDQILRLVANAENAYWEVVSARESLRVQEQSLSLFDATLQRAKRELELGAISELEIFQPQAQYANAEILVTQARFRLEQAEDQLRRQMGVDLDPKLRTLPIVLTEDVTAPIQTGLDKEDIVEKALRQRPDLRSVRQNLDVADLTISSTANLLRPDLRLTGQYGTAGRGGVFYDRNTIVTPDGIEQRVINVIPGGFGDALHQTFGFNYPVYGFGLALQLPIRDRRASADYADAVVSKKMTQLNIRAQEQVARLEVLNAITQVENSKASIELAKIATDLAQKRVAADQKRYDLGTITLFFLLDAQTQLNQAQSALVNQTVQYRRNLTALHRVTGDLLTERGINIQ